MDGQTIAKKDHNLTTSAPVIRVREFGKDFSLSAPATKADVDKELKAIHLMVMENPSLWHSNSNNRIQIARTKKNEFKILDNVYYYRTNDNLPKNYFYMNITRNSCQSHETIQRNYGIYWGSPRVSCVGIVETKGVLDDETKDFVYQQVKKSLFEKDGQQKMLLSVTQPKMQPLPMKPCITPVPTVIPAVIKPTVQKAFDSLHTADPQIKNFDCGPIQTAEQNNSKALTNFISSLNSKPLIISQKTTPSLTRPKYTKPHSMPKLSATTVDNTDAIALQMSPDEREVELTKLYKLLTPAMRKLINKLKYFEMYNGAVYTVTVGPNFAPAMSQQQPFNIIFIKHKPGATIKPMSKDLEVSVLVNNIFRAIHPVLYSDNVDTVPKKSTTRTTPVIQKTVPKESTPQSTPSQPTSAAISVHGGRPTSINIKSEPIPTSSQMVVMDSWEKKTAKKHHNHKCQLCGEIFERSYQLKRHEFVKHQIDDVDDNLMSHHTNISTDEPIIQESFTTNFDYKSPIKIAMRDEKSLLVPLFEIPIDEESRQFPDYCSNFLSVECKQEPEEHIEEVRVLPLSPVNYPVQPKKSRKSLNISKTYADSCFAEDTDSASESQFAAINKKKKVKLPQKRKKKRSPVVQQIKLNRKQTKRLKSFTGKVKIHKNCPLGRVKISEAKQFMKDWPILTVNLIDIRDRRHRKYR